MRNEKFAPSLTSIAICKEIIEAWKEEHGIEVALEEQAMQLASRVNTWVAPRSVLAGVTDVVTPHITGREDREAVIEQLGNRLGQRLMDDGLLIASPRRAGTLS